MILYDTTIKKGQNTVVKIPVANLPSGTEINLQAHVFRSKKPGPVLLLVGGLHGDEINGVEIVRRAMKSKMLQNLVMGSVIVVPLLNVYGFINFSRGLPDGKDVNRSFPGSKSGSLASRVAYKFTNEILPHATFAVDFHTGGNSVFNYPQARYFNEDKASAEIAEAMNLPYTIHSKLISRSLRKTAHSKGIPLVVFEGGESLRMDEDSIQHGLRSIHNVLIAQKMIADQPVEPQHSYLITDRYWIRAGRSGLLNLKKKAGDQVKTGEVLAKITDPYNTYKLKVIAKKSGYIFGHNNNPVVSRGDALFHIGTEE
jgi:predicted deacylase